MNCLLQVTVSNKNIFHLFPFEDVVTSSITLVPILLSNFMCIAAHLKCMKSACIKYFKLGGECVTGPVGLLSM